jgi:SAM-dependent methyltransferase
VATALQARFDRIYATNQWGAGSGNGSLPVHTHGYIALLERFLTERRIESVIDMGCGDWQFSRLVDWRGAEYRGYDVVSAVIEANTKAFGRPGVSFHGYDGDPRKLPSADLLIVKDVLQHLSDDRINATLAELPRYRYALLTNCVNVSGETLNADVADGGFRPLDLRKAPFSLDAAEVYSFTDARRWPKSWFRGPKWRKSVLLVENTATTRERNHR